MTATTTGVREGFTTVTPYIFVADIEGLVKFAKEAFGAVEMAKAIGESGHAHYELRIGDSMLMCGGRERSRELRQALHIYVPDADAVYQRALGAGGESLGAPQNRPYGERQGGVKDPTGNLWYIATRFPNTPAVPGMRAVTPYLHLTAAVDFIGFLKHAFQAEELGVYKSPEGRVMHAAVRIGDAIVEMGEAEPMPCGFYLYVPDADAVYQQAVNAGAKTVLPPSEMPYGDRLAAVEDQWGNSWAIATNLASSRNR